MGGFHIALFHHGVMKGRIDLLMPQQSLDPLHDVLDQFPIHDGSPPCLIWRNIISENIREKLSIPLIRIWISGMHADCKIVVLRAKALPAVAFLLKIIKDLHITVDQD